MTRFIVLLLLIGAAASCQSIIGLGDEPAYTPGCGISKAPGPVCAKCLESSCCTESIACANDPVCKDTVERCFAKCFDISCFVPCLEGAGQALSTYFNCAAHCAEDCAPKGVCKALSECCLEQENDSTLQKGCIDNARSENETLCQSSYDQLMCETGAAGAPAE